MKTLVADIGGTNSRLAIAITSRQDKEITLKNIHKFRNSDFNNFDEVITHKRIDAIYIPLANEEHTEPALKAIRSKKHLLIEKPMAIKSSEVELLISEAKKNNVKKYFVF